MKERIVRDGKSKRGKKMVPEFVLDKSNRPIRIPPFSDLGLSFILHDSGATLTMTLMSKDEDGLHRPREIRVTELSSTASLRGLLSPLVRIWVASRLSLHSNSESMHDRSYARKATSAVKTASQAWAKDVDSWRPPELVAHLTAIEVMSS